MKNQFHFLLLISCTLHTALAQEKQPTHKEQDFSVCYELKKINPDASRSKFDRLAKKFADNKVTTCECINYLMAKKQEKALDIFLAQKFNKDDFDSIKHAYKIYNENKREELEPDDLYVHVEPDFQLPQEIEQMLQDIFPTATFKILQNNNNNLVPFAATKRTKLRNHLYLGDKLFILPITIIRPIILHEKKHLTNDDTFIRIQLIKLAEKYNPDNYVPKLPGLELLGLRLYRAQEAEADRIPSACGSCKDAYESVLMIKLLFDMQEGFSANSKDSHPSGMNRLEWAYRIYKLKVAEEEHIASLTYQKRCRKRRQFFFPATTYSQKTKTL